MKAKTPKGKALQKELKDQYGKHGKPFYTAAIKTPKQVVDALLDAVTVKQLTG